MWLHHKSKAWVPCRSHQQASIVCNACCLQAGQTQCMLFASRPDTTTTAVCRHNVSNICSRTVCKRQGVSRLQLTRISYQLRHHQDSFRQGVEGDSMRSAMCHSSMHCIMLRQQYLECKCEIWILGNILERSCDQSVHNESDLRNALAMATLCFSPPLSLRPRSPTMVS